MDRVVETSKDALGWLLVYARDFGGYREGEPVGAPDYFKSKAAADRAAAKINRREAGGALILSTSDKRRLVGLVRKIETEREKIAASRDRLREYIAEVEDIIRDADEVVSDLERSTDTLSKYL